MREKVQIKSDRVSIASALARGSENAGKLSRHFGLDPLYNASAGAALARGLENALAARQRCADCRFLLRVDPRPTDRLAALRALVSRPGKPRVYPFLNDRALELCK